MLPTTAAASGKKDSSYSRTPLKEFFINSLKEIYWAEQEIMRGLKQLQQATTHTGLLHAFAHHKHETRKHIVRLENIFKWLKERSEAKKCFAMEGILKEADEIIAGIPEGTAARDAFLILAARKVEHYEIACYGGLVAIAYTLGKDKIARLLERTLWEEEQTDRLLSAIAASGINFKTSGDQEPQIR